MLVVVAYDICSPRRWRRIYKILKGYGRAVQYSVFECELNEPQLRHLQARLQSEVHPDEDHIRFYRLCGSCRDLIEGRGVPVVERGTCIII